MGARCGMDRRGRELARAFGGVLGIDCEYLRMCASGVMTDKRMGGRNLSERLPGSLQTNNRAEMYVSPVLSPLCVELEVLIR
jgi:hypothetical protein